MCHETSQLAFLHDTQLYLSTNLDHILFSNILLALIAFLCSVLMCRKAVNQSINQSTMNRTVPDM